MKLWNENSNSRVFSTMNVELHADADVCIILVSDDITPPFRVQVRPSGSEEDSSNSSSDPQGSNPSSPSSELPSHQQLQQQSSSIPEDCLNYLVNQMKSGREIVMAIRPLNRWSRYSPYPDGVLAYNTCWNEAVVGFSGDYKTESNFCLHGMELQWRYKLV